MADTLTNPTAEVRRDMATAAAIKLAGIAGPLQFLTSNGDDPEVEAAHELAIRVEELSNVILAALGDGRIDLDQEQYRLAGPEMHRRGKRADHV
jgi:hypothetical protein